MRTHKDLDVWKIAIELSKHVYEMTKGFPKAELFGLTSQMRRAAVSVASNIAEGAARNGNKEYIQFLYIAAGSASELDTQIEVARSVGIGAKDTLDAAQRSTEKVAQMLQGLIRALKARS
jgi:four helix bundle protein